jgi:phenylacetate-CoA ligase
MTTIPGRADGNSRLTASPVEAWTAACTGLASPLTPATLAAWQLERVRAAIRYARGRSRFYWRALTGVDETSWSSLDDVRHVPFTWPADVARDPLAFVCVPQSTIARVTTIPTSGTTGPSKRVSFTERDLQRTIAFFEHGMQTLVRTGDHVLILMSGETEHSMARLLEAGLSRVGVTAEIRGRLWDAARALAAARSADCIVGVPAEVFYLSRIDGRLRPKNVLLSADYVPPSIVSGIERAWHCDVLTHYGMTESGFAWAVQCGAKAGHHLRHAELLTEIVALDSGDPVEPGELGEITLTTLVNEAMPLIRYRTGDLSRIVVEPCACGGVLPRLGRVEGRRETDVQPGHGPTLSMHRLDDWLFAVPGMRAFSASLRTCGAEHTLELAVDADPPVQEAAVAAWLPDGVRLQIRQSMIDPFAGGTKRRLGP